MRKLDKQDPSTRFSEKDVRCAHKKLNDQISWSTHILQNQYDSLIKRRSPAFLTSQPLLALSVDGIQATLPYSEDEKRKSFVR